LYTLITRSAEGDTFEVMGPISAVHPASDHPGADRARSAVEADDEPTAISGVLETLSSGLGDDSELVRVIIEQMAALQR
jgi:hypothetical protein